MKCLIIAILSVTVILNDCVVDMSRDKCGAAAVAGFLKIVSMLAPKHVNITAGLSLVRNSIGSDSYVSDEVLYSRNGTRGEFIGTYRQYIIQS